MKTWNILVLVAVLCIVTAEAKSKKKSKSEADSASKNQSPNSSAIIAIQIVDPNENKTSSKNYKRTIDSSLGYGYQSFLGPTHQQPRYEVYKYSQHNIPAYKGPPYNPFSNSKLNIQKSVSYELPPITQYIPPGTTLFSKVNQKGHVSDLSSEPPQHPSHSDQPVPVVILRIFPSQLKDVSNALYPNLPHSHPLANKLNSVDIQSLLLNYVKNLPQNQQQPKKGISNYQTPTSEQYQPDTQQYYEPPTHYQTSQISEPQYQPPQYRPQVEQYHQPVVQNYQDSTERYQSPSPHYHQYQVPGQEYHEPVQQHRGPGLQYQSPIQDHQDPAQQYQSSNYHNQESAQQYQSSIQQHQEPAQQYQSSIQQHQEPAQQYQSPIQEHVESVQQYQTPIQHYSQQEQQYQEPQYQDPSQDYQYQNSEQQYQNQYLQSPHYEPQYIPQNQYDSQAQYEPSSQYEQPIPYQGPQYLPNQYPSGSVDEKEAKPYSSSGLLTHENYPSEKHTRVIFKTKHGEVKVPSKEDTSDSNIQTKTIKIHVPSDIGQVQVQESEIPYGYSEQQGVEADKSENYFYFRQIQKEPNSIVYESPAEKSATEDIGEARPTKNYVKRRRTKKRKVVTPRPVVEEDQEKVKK